MLVKVQLGVSHMHYLPLTRGCVMTACLFSTQNAGVYLRINQSKDSDQNYTFSSLVPNEPSRNGTYLRSGCVYLYLWLVEVKWVKWIVNSSQTLAQAFLYHVCVQHLAQQQVPMEQNLGEKERKCASVQRATPHPALPTSEYWHANDVQLRQQKPQRSACMQPQWPLAWVLTLLQPDMCRLFHVHTMRRSLVESAHSPGLVFPFSLSVTAPYFTQSPVTPRAQAPFGVFCQALWRAGSSTQQHLRHSESGVKGQTT